MILRPEHEYASRQWSVYASYNLTDNPIAIPNVAVAIITDEMCIDQQFDASQIPVQVIKNNVILVRIVRAVCSRVPA